jgi:peptidoglycan-N-acetylglucosamine deacetylase
LTPSVHAQLRERGFLYDSSLMGFDHPYSLDGLTEVPVERIVDDSPYFRYVGDPSDKGRPSDPAAVLNAWLEELITVHDWISGRGQRTRMLCSLLSHIRRASGTWITTSEDIARHHIASENHKCFDLPLKPLETAIDS